jgi:hypothetical protein
MPRYIVKDAGIYEARRYRVIDSRQANAEVLRTRDRKIAEGLCADYNDRYAPTLFVLVARWFGFLRPKPFMYEQEEWQRRIALMDIKCEQRKKVA